MAETVLGLTSVDVSLISAAISLVSVYVAIRLAWSTRFSPPKLVGTIPYAILWTFCERKDGKPNGFFLVPFFWLSNSGARPMLVGDMRLVVSPHQATSFTLFPLHSVPAEAIESPNNFSDYELLRIGDAPFGGFAVSNTEKWKNHYVFSLSPEQRAALSGSTELRIEVRPVGRRHFEKVLRQRISFSSSAFNWLTWAGVGGPLAEYFYSEDRRPH